MSEKSVFVLIRSPRVVTPGGVTNVDVRVQKKDDSDLTEYRFLKMNDANTLEEWVHHTELEMYQKFSR